VSAESTWMPHICLW